MEFIKRHYEKLILLVLSLIFIATMVHVLGVITRTREVKESDLQIPTRQADYQVQDGKSDRFVPDRFVANCAPDWQKSAPRSAVCANHFSDLVKVFQMSACPHCNRIIPRYYFSEKNCPECHKELKTPPDRPKGRVGLRTADDTDGDGMKNVDEQKYGFNPEDNHDALQDADGDGFSNVFEVEQGTDPKNPLSHPPLWWRLRFAGMDRVALPVTFKALNTQNNPDKTKWDIQLNFLRRNYRGEMKERTSIEMLGGIVNIDKRDYKIVDIELNQKRVKVPKKDKMRGEIENEEVVDNSRIFLEEVVYPGADGKTPVPDKMTIKVGEPAYSSDRRLILEDIGILPDEKTNKHPVYILRPGEHLNLGDRRIGVSRLVLREVDEENKTALFVHASSRSEQDPSVDATGKRMVVTAHSATPEESWVLYPVTKATENEENMM